MLGPSPHLPCPGTQVSFMLNAGYFEHLEHVTVATCVPMSRSLMCLFVPFVASAANIECRIEPLKNKSQED